MRFLSIMVFAIFAAILFTGNISIVSAQSLEEPEYSTSGPYKQDFYEVENQDAECRQGLTLLHHPPTNKYYCADSKSAEGLMKQGAVAIKGDYVKELNLMYGVNLEAEQRKMEINAKVIPGYSPKKQHNDGIEAHKIHCKTGMHLILRYSGEPACVKESTLERIIERNWGNHPPKISDADKELLESGLIIEVTDVTQLGTGEKTMYQISFKVDSGENLVSELEVVVKSDSDMVKLELGQIQQETHFDKAIVIGAIDPESITAKIGSFHFVDEHSEGTPDN